MRMGRLFGRVSIVVIGCAAVGGGLARDGATGGPIPAAGAQLVASPQRRDDEVVSGPARILDGDTLEIGGQTVRLLHIDAPETGQSHGATATATLAALAEGRRVTCRGAERDTHGRLLATCTAGARDLSAEMVARGAAVVFRRYGDTHAGLEAAARDAGRGLWADPDPVMPWDYRAGRWQAAAAAAPPPDGCPIKGNITAAGERIYHAPWSRWYDRTRVNLSAGERWFCTEAEALTAGWRAPRG